MNATAELVPHKMRWTITLPDDSAFDAVIDNTYESEMGMHRLLELAGCDAYAGYENYAPPITTEDNHVSA